MKQNILNVAFHACYAHPLPEGHRFPMLKYELIPEQLCHEGTLSMEHFFSPGICTDEDLLLTHDPLYLHKLHHQQLSPSEQRKIGFPQSPELTNRELVITRGTIECCRHARENGIAMNVAGGTHHAFADRGEGFCLLNDMAVAANVLLKDEPALQLLIIDLDVHQGNGTAKIFEREPRVFTFSMHGKNNYPFHKEKSDLDIELPDGTDDDRYLDLLAKNLDTILSKMRPDLAFYLSGVDILDSDRFGKLRVSLEGCKQRDRMVFEQLRIRGIPCVVAMGGGYSPDIRRIVEAHCNTFRTAKDVFACV
jgi:acetoin utilization deacetylase AcuC-like enzyme